MFQIIQNDSRIDIREGGEVYDHLPVGIYSVEYDEVYGIFYLSKKGDSFKLPSKLYGDHSIVDRWISSYHHNTTKNLGILLSGLKGTGKTITAELFCNKIQKPVITFTKAWTGPKFINFITNPMFYDTVLFIDEFEKIYASKNNNDEAQESMLSLMDGIFDTRFIFLLTVNKNTISEYLINRLNRIKYYKNYDNLEKEIIDEVVEDLLEDKTLAPSITTFYNEYNICTFDILVNVIKEMNLFKEDAISCAQHLLLIPEKATWSVSQIVNEEIMFCENIKLAKVSCENGLQITRNFNIIKKLRELNEQLKKEYELKRVEGGDATIELYHNQSQRITLPPHNTTIEEESDDIIRITYTPHSYDEELPSVYVFEKLGYRSLTF